MNAEPLLQVEGLHVDIHGTSILRDVSFSLAAGSSLGIIGESGSGKSMTALSVMQLLPRGSEARGAIRLAGQSLMTMDEPALCDIRGQSIGMVFQEPMTALNPVQPIGKQVAECIWLHRHVSRKEAFELAAVALERVGLPPAKYPLTRFPHELSGGQRQRVVIAMAVALRPKLLIADEPTTALDVTTQAGILELLIELTVEDNTALLLITHDLAVVGNMADELLIMRDGEVLDRGPTDTVFRDLRHAYTRTLFAASDHVPNRVIVDASTQNKMDAPLLEVTDLVCEYVGRRRSIFGKPTVFRAVDTVSFKIDTSESVGLVGESGCGKSTLARALLGLAPVQGGQVRLRGQQLDAVSGVSRALRRDIQVVFQDPYGSFNPRHRVDRLIAEPLHLLETRCEGSERQDRLADALTDVGLSPDDGRRFIHEFSGGQRQRIAIARALIIKPALIVLDEAVSALDVSVRAQILDLLASLADSQHLAYLFISHDLSVVRAITDRVLVMQSGVVVERGHTDHVFDNPQHAYTQSLLAAVPGLRTA